MCHGAAQNFAGEAAARTFLGVFEASVNPGTMLLFSMYYECDEQPLRMGIWIGAGGLGYVVAGIASFGIGPYYLCHTKLAIALYYMGIDNGCMGCVIGNIPPRLSTHNELYQRE